MKIARNDRVEFRLEGDEKFDLDFYSKVMAKVADWPGKMTVEVKTFEKMIIVRSMTTIHASHDKIAVPSDQSTVVAPTAPAFAPPAPEICRRCREEIEHTAESRLWTHKYAGSTHLPIPWNDSDGPRPQPIACIDCHKSIVNRGLMWLHADEATEKFDHRAVAPSDAPEPDGF